MIHLTQASRQSKAPDFGDTEVRRHVHDLLEQVDDSPERFHEQLAQLECRHKGEVYVELIDLLSHLRIDEADAKRDWNNIIEHRECMEGQLGKRIDIRVALLDYYVAVNCRLKNPTVIEMKLFDKTRESAYRDELTGLYNYRFFNEHLAREISRAGRTNSALSLAVIDVDDFKHYNDQNGHVAGNHALTRVARILNESLRTEDVTARYGGEEFALILPATPKLGAKTLAESLCRRIAAHRFPNDSAQPGGVLSVSIGVATVPADAIDAEELMRCADHAMYSAKSHGKNQVQLFGQSSRSHRRVDAALHGNFRLLSNDSRPLKTVSISDGGLMFVTDSDLPAGSPIEIDLRLPELERVPPLFGRVIYAKPTDDGQFLAAVRLEDSSDANRRLLAGFVGEATC